MKTSQLKLEKIDGYALINNLEILIIIDNEDEKSM